MVNCVFLLFKHFHTKRNNMKPQHDEEQQAADSSEILISSSTSASREVHQYTCSTFSDGEVFLHEVNSGCK